MATTVHEPPKIEIDRLPGRGSGNGGWRNPVSTDGDLRRVKDSSPPPASTGIWVGLAAITMSFAAFTSALIVRQGTARFGAHHFTSSALPEHARYRCQQLHARNSAPQDCGLYGRHLGRQS